MPLPKVPQRGDAARLQQLASGLKMEHGTYGAVVQRNDVGRPTGSGGTPAPRASAQQEQISPDFQNLAMDAATAEWVRQVWERIAQRFPSTYTQLYREQADAVARHIHGSVFNASPNFEE